MSDLMEDGWKTLNEAWKFTKRTAMSTPEMEVKVEEATSNAEWGPASAQLTEIASASYRYSELPLIMGTLYRRIQDTGKNWRHVYKSLVVMDYLLKHGSDDSIRSLRAHSLEIQQLTHFHFIDEHKDVGQAIRSKVKVVLELIHDDSKLREERDKAKKNRGKYQGYGSDTPGAFRGGYEDEYDRSPYRQRREEAYPSPKPYRKELSDSDDSEDSDSDTKARAPTGGRRPRAPSDEKDRAKITPVPAPKPTVNLVDLDGPSELTFPTTPSPFFPPPVGAGGGNLFEAFPPPSGGGGGGGATFAPFPPTGGQPPLSTTPIRPTQPAHEEEWDAFKSFETPRDQSDIWYQHKSLFDLQHLNLADQKVPPKPEENKKNMGAMLAEKQKGKPGSTLGQPAAPPSLGRPATTPQLGQPTIMTPSAPPSQGLGVPAYGNPALVTPALMGQPVYPAGYGMGMPVYPAGYPPNVYAPMGGGLPATGGMGFATPYKPATTGAK